MELLSKNYERWANDVNMEMPQLVNREKASGSSIANFTKIHENILNSQYKPQEEALNFSVEEEKQVVESEKPAMTEKDFIKNLAEGKYVAELEKAIANKPMNVFGNGAGLQDSIETSGTNPNDFVVVENKQVSEKTEIAGPREVAPLMPGESVAGINTEPVVAPEEALPEEKVQPTEAAIPAYPEEKIVGQDTSISDPTSLQSSEMLESVFDQAEAKKNEEIELYKQFMSNVM